MKNLPKLILSIIACELVGILSTPFTVAAIPTWYATLIKPSFAPPNWLFGPAWTLLYLCMGISFYLISISKLKKKNVNEAKKYFFFQLACNFIWSPVFFGLHNPMLGLIVIILLWILILLTMQKFYPISKPAFYLLVPYILWVSFATTLNAAIVLLN
jgi:benzodiazapine receptor